jgi:hypothetical protein
MASGYVGLGVALFIIGIILAALNLFARVAAWIMWLGLILIAVGIILTIAYWVAAPRVPRYGPPPMPPP